MADYQKPIPQPTPETQHFWDGCKDGKLLLQRCKDTGKAYFVAIATHKPEPHNPENIAAQNVSGPEKELIIVIPCPSVEDTEPPTRLAPRSSKIPAMTQACRMLSALEPTDVPRAFATSFAPVT